MSSLNNGDGPLRLAIVQKLNADLDHTLITGIDANPIVAQSPVPAHVSEPYIYIRSEDSIESFITKGSSSRLYTILAEVVIKASGVASGAGVQTRDDIVNEIVAIFDVNTEEYIVVPEFNNYIQNVSVLTMLPAFIERGGTYHKSVVELSFTMSFTGEARTATPFQNPVYAYDGFEFAPSRDNIELYDLGSITGANTYSTPNNGWTFDSATYALAAGSDGTIVDRVVTVAIDDANVDIESTLTYTRLDSDNQVLTRTTDFNRIRSLRYGVLASTARPEFTDDVAVDLGLQSLNQWDEGNRHLMFNTVNPRGTEVSFEGNAGEFVYFVFDANESITNITNIAAGIEESIIANFTTSMVGGYEIYTMRRPLSFTSSYTMKLD